MCFGAFLIFPKVILELLTIVLELAQALSYTYGLEFYF